MNIPRISTPLFMCLILTTHFCNAFWPLPTQRDIVIAGGAAAGTVLLLRNYYLGQEQRIRADIHAENDLTRSTVLTQGQETRSVVQTAGQEVVAAVEDTHADVRRIETQTNTLLRQGGALAEMLLFLIQGQSRIENSLGCSYNGSAPLIEELRENSFSQRQLPAPRPHYSVQVTALAAKMPCKNFEQLQKIPVQLQIRTQAPGHQALYCPRHTIQAHGSTEDTSWSASFKNGYSTIGKLLLGKNPTE